MKSASKLLIVAFTFFISQFGFSQMNQEKVIFEDVVLNLTEGGLVQINLKECADGITHRKVEIYEILFDTPIVNEKGDKNGVTLQWDSTKYYGEWQQTKGDYKMVITYTDFNNKKINKVVGFTIK